MKLSVPAAETRDIPMLDQYWQKLSDEDVARMGIDRAKLPTSAEFTARVAKTLETPVKERLADPLIWELDGRAVGFTNLNAFDRPKQAEIHLHLIDKSLRGKGLGAQWFALSLKKYFQRHGLEKIVCQPAAANAGPNGMMRSLGIAPVRTYVTTPSVICVE